MQLKEYQQRALDTLRRYLGCLAAARGEAEKVGRNLVDFPTIAWEEAGLRGDHRSRRNGLRQHLPTFCMKIPTGGGKTLLAVKMIELINLVYLKRKNGVVLWIVPTMQIYRQTARALKDRDHPYRQHLDMASGGRTLVLEKPDHFSRQDVEENLCVLLLMLPSANRKTKESLKIFQDSGSFQGFFPPEDDTQAQTALLERVPNLDTYGGEGGFWGRQIKTSLGNALRTLSPLIILDEGHKAYSDGAQETLRGFNPCMIAELSATPKASNILVNISGRELHREEMIKLDLHLVNKTSPDWKDALLAGASKRNVLEEKAQLYGANTGIYIRPICLIQVERTGKDQRDKGKIHSEEVREHLIRVMGISPDEIAVKTSEKDELKEIDDTGGLLARNCKIRYIITKQALQEGWDCSFAYVLVILTNPSSTSALTQLVGRILRQPYARKTHMRELDECYVFCFQRKAQELVRDISKGFEQEGLGDLRGNIDTRNLSGTEEPPDRVIPVREKFRDAAARTFLPVFVVKNGRSWRAVDYEMDIASRIPWEEVDLRPVTRELTLSYHEAKDFEIGITLSDDRFEPVQARGHRELKEGGIRLDAAFMTRQLCDVVPNAWQAHEFSKAVLDYHLNHAKGDERLVTINFVYLIEKLREQVETEKDRLAKRVFEDQLERKNIRFLLIGDNFDWTFPKTLAAKPAAKTLNRADNTQLQMSLFEFQPEDGFNETEKMVAWYLENQSRLFFWFRNQSRKNYSIQGWQQHRIYPDFIFTAKDADSTADFDLVYVLETKGLHLKDNAKTNYVRQLFNICTREAKLRHWTELGLEMQGKSLKFEVLTENEWENKLNQILQV